MRPENNEAETRECEAQNDSMANELVRMKPKTMRPRTNAKI